MSGVCGWIGLSTPNAAAVIDAMTQRVKWPRADRRESWHQDRAAIAAVGPAIAANLSRIGPLVVAWQGHPFWLDDPARVPPAAEFSARLANEYLERGPAALERVGGDFALAVIHHEKQVGMLAVDRVGVHNLVYRMTPHGIVFGPSCDVVAAFPGVERRVRPQAIYDYVYFHMVPGPDTAFEGMSRLPPGHYLEYADDRARVAGYWQMRFDEDRRAEFGELKQAFRGALDAGVGAFGASGEVGAFLSGGTDSSTVSGLLGRVNGSPARTYSIGFEAAGYDEMEYARIAARHFSTEHHEYYVTPADVLAAVPTVAAAYDQPFGNASAIPTYYCASRAASDGIARLLAGDGGDELFGGNARYARQSQLALYERVPRQLRERIVEPLLLRRSWPARLPLGRRGRSYVEQARLPMPARYESYNLLERLGPENVFEFDFLSAVDRSHPLATLQSTYDAVGGESLINRMLGLDLKFTLADNDLPKVTQMCNAAGVDVAFPLLHESVVSFSASLEPRLKLKGAQLRYFFKEALRDFLPEQILRKEKHGFGLPAGVWLRDYRPLSELASDALGGLRRRGIFRRQLLDDLLSTHIRAHPGYYGTMVWILMMLEQWYELHTASVKPAPGAE